MSPNGTSVQYLAGGYQSETFHPMAATVVEDWDEETKNLKVHLDGTNSLSYGFSDEEVLAGFAWRTSVKRGDTGGHWRPIPQEGT